MTQAYAVNVHGIVQGVGFRPFIFRLARANTLVGWVLNRERGVNIHVEGSTPGLESFLRALRTEAPPAAQITGVDVHATAPSGFLEFKIRGSRVQSLPTAGIAPDLALCHECRRELFDPADSRHGYAYINCTNCGPRFSVLHRLPYDRPNTTMAPWMLDPPCDAEYRDPASRRFQAQPIACPSCGPGHYLARGTDVLRGDDAAIRAAAGLLKAGNVVGIKGLGGYHLAADAANEEAVTALRNRKYRREQPFALMADTLDTARLLVALTAAGEALLESSARPIVLARARREMPGVAPDNGELGVMLPYTPVHHLLFAAGAPAVLVMTSGNRSNEPIVINDDEALSLLAGIADAVLVGERPIARRVDDSVIKVGVMGPTIIRRARGYAPAASARIPTTRPILALGGDRKNTVTLVVDGQAFMSQHVGDLVHRAAFHSFTETIDDLRSMYDVDWADLLVVSDAHPRCRATQYAAGLPAGGHAHVQHQRAHVASVLAERGAWDRMVLGVALDGTGYGDDRSTWGGEFFVGSVRSGFRRVAHVRPFGLAGGDTAVRHPVQAAAGFLAQLDDLPDMARAPFGFPHRFEAARRRILGGQHVLPSTSMGRLFDTAAALAGFTRESTFDGQAATWLEHLARSAPAMEPYPFPFDHDELDFRPLLREMIDDRLVRRDRAHMARAFHAGVAAGLVTAIEDKASRHQVDTVVLSGGVFQNELLLGELKAPLSARGLAVWTNHQVPPNDGGLSLGQAALAAFGQYEAA